MKRSTFVPLIASTAVLMLAGCAPTTPQVDSRFGQTMRLTMAQQTLNPDAASKDVPEAMDGSATRETVVRYRNSFKEPPPPQNVFNIGVGGGTGQGR